MKRRTLLILAGITAIESSLQANPFSTIPRKAGRQDVAKVRAKRLILFVTDIGWHSLVIKAEGGCLDQLQRAGWTIGKGPSFHIQIVDASTVEGRRIWDDIASQVDVPETPAFVYMEGGKPVKTLDGGGVDAVEVSDFFHDKKEAAEAGHGMGHSMPRRRFFRRG